MNTTYQTPFRKRSSASEFRQAAREALKERWGKAIGMFLLACLLGFSSESGFSFSTQKKNDNTNPVPPQAAVEEITQEYQAMAQEMQELIETGDLLGAAEYAAVNLIGTTVLLAFLFTVLFGVLYGIFVGSPATVGYQRFNLDLIDRKPKLSVGVIGFGFQHCYLKSVTVKVLLGLIQLAILVATAAAGVLVCIVTVAFSPALAVFLAFLAVIAGGVVSIVVSYRYALCYHILAEYPELSATDVLRNSAALMQGNKMRLFLLNLSFLGWILLAACCTCGIGMLVVSPYSNAATAAFYFEVTGHDTAKDVEFPSVDPEDYFPNL